MGSGLTRPNSVRNFSLYGERKSKRPKRAYSVPTHLETLNNTKNSETINGFIQLSIDSKDVSSAHEKAIVLNPKMWSDELEASMNGDSNELTSSALFNLITEESWNGKLQIHATDFLLPIDCRTEEEFDKQRIASSVHHSTVNEKYIENEIKKYHMIALYCAGSDNAQLLQLSKLLSSLEIDFFVFKNGFEEFYSRYSFLCTTKALLSNSLRQDFFKLYPSEILPNRLYQGNAYEALTEEVLSSIGITHIINVTTEHPNKYENIIQYLQIRLDDSPTSDLKSWLKITLKFINSAFTESERSKVLVHCNMGRSRSSTIVLGFLMDSLKWPLSKASSWLKDCRPTVIPNNGFIVQLLEYEKEVFGSQLSSLNDIPF